MTYLYFVYMVGSGRGGSLPYSISGGAGVRIQQMA